MRPKIIFCDFDGTLTSPGSSLRPHQLDKTFFQILDLVAEKNWEFVIVSGRPLSWGHFLLTHFPLKVVMMEGGGVLLVKGEKGGIKETCLVPEQELKGLEDVTARLLETFPQITLSADSFGRKTDRAIDLDHENLTPETLDKIRNFLLKENVSFSSSNVHLNFWKGEVSKYKAVSHFLNYYRHHFQPADCLFFGDAPNDQSMFRHFPHSVGVSNIVPFLHQMEFHPKTVLQGRENEGPLGVLNYLSSLGFH